MKILYHHRTASKDGQAVHIEEMISALSAQGHEVRVVAPKVAGNSGEMGGKAGWVHWLKHMLPRAVYELLEFSYSLIAFKQLKEAADSFKPDFIYERYNLFLLAGLMLKKTLGIPLLLEVNSPLVYERSRHSGGLSLSFLAKWAEAKAWCGADFVLPVTQVLAQHLIAAGVAPEKICVVPNGINETHFSSAPEPEDAKAQLDLNGRLVLGFTGFVREWHGVDRVIRWMSNAKAPEAAFLLIVGDGPARNDLEKLAESLGIRERVRFTGVVDRDKVPQYVAAFDIALQPAVTAYASPLKMIEYLALGKAIVAPMEPNLLEILSDQSNAIMFDQNQEGGLERALDSLCADPVLRRKLSVGAKDTIRRMNLTWSGNASKVVELANSSIERSKTLGGRR